MFRICALNPWRWQLEISRDHPPRIFLPSGPSGPSLNFSLLPSGGLVVCRIHFSGRRCSILVAEEAKGRSKSRAARTRVADQSLEAPRWFV